MKKYGGQAYYCACVMSHGYIGLQSQIEKPEDNAKVDCAVHNLNFV